MFFLSFFLREKLRDDNLRYTSLFWEIVSLSLVKRGFYMCEKQLIIDIYTLGMPRYLNLMCNMWLCIQP